MDPRTKLWKHQVRLVRAAVNRRDPMGLIKSGFPDDEYDPELPGVMRAIADSASSKQLADRIRQVFVHMFGNDYWPTNDLFESLAQDLWNLRESAEWTTAGDH